MVKIIGEFSQISKVKIWVEQNFPVVFEYCYLHPGMRVQDYFNGIKTRQLINDWSGDLFDAIQIETINRCNGACKFCPVSYGNDPRERQEMPWDLFVHIVSQLGAIDYSGGLALFNNNEPLMDKRIIDMVRFARRAVPHSVLNLFTNGTLLTRAKFAELIAHLDFLYLDNYNPKRELNKASVMALDYIKDHPEFSNRLIIHITRPDAIRGSRAGLAKNRIFQHLSSPCWYPWQQMIVRPDGKTSLCCMEAYGSLTLADLTKEPVVEAWNNNNYRELRALMKSGRQKIPQCRNCDTCIFGVRSWI